VSSHDGRHDEPVAEDVLLLPPISRSTREAVRDPEPGASRTPAPTAILTDFSWPLIASATCSLRPDPLARLVGMPLTALATMSAIDASCRRCAARRLASLGRPAARWAYSASFW